MTTDETIMPVAITASKDDMSTHKGSNNDIQNVYVSITDGKNY